MSGQGTSGSRAGIGDVVTEREKHNVEKDKVAAERVKAWAAALAVVGSVLAASISATVAHVSAVWLQTKQADAALELQDSNAQKAFELKVAEIVMSGTAHEGSGKLVALKAMFPTMSQGVSSFDPDTLSWGRDSKNMVLELIAREPSTEQRRVIVNTYMALFDAPKQEKWFTEAVVDAATAATPSTVPRRQTKPGPK